MTRSLRHNLRRFNLLNVRPLAVFKQNVPIEAPLNDSAVMGEDVADSFGADVFREGFSGVQACAVFIAVGSRDRSVTKRGFGSLLELAGRSFIPAGK
jgi:hypothetical protein